MADRPDVKHRPVVNGEHQHHAEREQNGRATRSLADGGMYKDS
ncbi:hypothetical protein TVNIR_0282 [Thioalkalivibrio nitratireducens DSM 14787]|uniref:Uncharacterized protein n=1 Tax=Thioalkalivibrio nitratireducens (strain DSM 14787 / UNIQEM 213 / ALEN2) TaxID=1255043 RepID=L0DSK9_THIND|nr:hypothetical protein TVNIR_0282 [Thioalkalivibrio nitratireducens DSM 14787]